MMEKTICGLELNTEVRSYHVTSDMDVMGVFCEDQHRELKQNITSQGQTACYRPNPAISRRNQLLSPIRSAPSPAIEIQVMDNIYAKSNNWQPLTGWFPEQCVVRDNCSLLSGSTITELPHQITSRTNSRVAIICIRAQSINYSTTTL